MSITLTWVDAFTDTLFAGNPAGVRLLHQPLTAAADPGPGAHYVRRAFGPNVGIDEDPATGSAQCVAGPYRSAAIGRPALVAHQLSARGAVLHVRPDGDRVHIGGNAVTVFTGHLCET
jgi:predicted PhzF superfamily epimerase YddE/YHI9